MWKKLYREAYYEMRLDNTEAAESLALKALKYARRSPYPKRLARSLSLLGMIYANAFDNRAMPVVAEAAEAAELAYGPNSLEQAEQLELYGCMLGETGDFAGGEKALLKGVSIREARLLERGDEFELCDGKRTRKLSRSRNSAEGTIGIMETLEGLQRLCFDHEKHTEAEKYLLKEMALAKSFYGPFSDEVKNLTDCYCEFLSGIGRDDDAEKLFATAG